MAPPATDLEFRNLWAFAMDLYVGGPNGNDADWVHAAQVLCRRLVLYQVL